MIDGHSRVAYVEARDETAESATEARINAVARFADRASQSSALSDDDGGCYKVPPVA